MITGYDVSSSSVATGDEVTVTLYLYRTDGRKRFDLASFAASTAFRVTAPIIRRLRRRVKMAQHILLTSTDLTYTGDDARTLKFTIYYTNENGKGAYQDGKRDYPRVRALHRAEAGA